MADPRLNPESSFRGFGDAPRPRRPYLLGRPYFMAGMEQGLYGASTRLSSQSVADSNSLSGLGDVYVYSNGLTENGSSVFALDTNGNLFTRALGGDSWTLYYKFINTYTGAGMVWGDDRKLYIVGDRYLAKFDAQFGPVTDGTIAVTNGSPNVVGTGTNFSSGFIAPFDIVIAGVLYKVNSVTDGTHIVLSTNYAGSTASGLAYRAFDTSNFNEKFQDFGASSKLSDSPAHQWAQPFFYEGDLLIPRKWQMCRYNSDGSWNGTSNAAFTLPTSLFIQSAAASNHGILMGVNHINGSNSYLILWDNISDGSLAPWLKLNDLIISVQPSDAGWIVLTNKRILLTNGYSYRTLSSGIDSRFGENSFASIPNGVAVVDKRVIINNQYVGYARKRSGTYIYLIDFDTYYFIPFLDKYGYNLTPNAIFIDPDQKVNVAGSTVLPATKYLTKITPTVPANAYVITQPLGTTPNVKHADYVKTDMAILEGSETISATITVKVAKLHRRIWGIQKAKAGGSDTSHITVDGTALGDVQVGDEIVILEGANAGLSRHVTAITGQGTSTEVWTLDTALTSNIEINAYINLTPFQKVDAKTVTSATELREMLFDVRNRYKGKKFIVKISFAGLTSPIELMDIELVTEDQRLQS